MTGVSWHDSMYQNRIAAEEAQAEQYAIARVDGHIPTKAADIAGYKGRKRSQPLKLIETPAMRARIQRAMLRAGATPEKAAERVVAALDARIGVRVDATGDIIPSSMPDHKVQLQAAKLVGEWLAPEDRSSTMSATVLNVNIGGAAGEMFAKAMSEKESKVIEGDKD